VHALRRARRVGAPAHLVTRKDTVHDICVSRRIAGRNIQPQASGAMRVSGQKEFYNKTPSHNTGHGTGQKEFYPLAQCCAKKNFTRELPRTTLGTGLARTGTNTKKNFPTCRKKD